MNRAVDYAKQQYLSVLEYTRKLGVEKPIHIGETGWASVSQGLYGDNGSHAADEYKQALYYQKIRDWTNKIIFLVSILRLLTNNGKILTIRMDLKIILDYLH